MALESKIDSPIRTLGAEFECCVPLMGSGSLVDVQRQIAGILNANGIRAKYRSYSHAPVDNCDIMVETDASVRGESRIAGITWIPLEIKTRIMHGMSDYMRIIPKTLEILRSLNCKVNASTGHHIHIGIQEVTNDPTVIRSLYNLIHRVEPVIYMLVPPSRRSSQYCRPLPDVAKLLHGCRNLACFEQTLCRFERYQGLNWQGLFLSDGAPRVEFRYFGGTLETEKSVHWARFCIQLINHAMLRTCQAATAQLPPTKEGLRKLLVTTGFKINTKVYSSVCPELRETGRYFLIKRWKQLHGLSTGGQPNSVYQEG